ncbi:Transcriptional regulator ligR LysR family [Paramagnetospirillum magnetotacticum MS-1]|uniref:Transcriptional regulator ligR LysR family n=1 Tax=Paramagnetospirillum magnetotacticum MS-1 TaxID=272627 RepID=A0A0C2YTV3_PARME|nr:LysR substrate-binding domain-containing protein [Paramagnetospirillum magnetotacticum]KIL98110.1 Transcriptional regulator ligR LysR family [Paramagnetospirillum magnetotacticum MS-1]
MNLKQLEYFVRVAELGSFSKAAMVLDIAQPALSRQVRLLETDLRANLLHRTGRGVALTEAGQKLFDHAVGILQSVERATEDLESARGEPAGRIVIGLPPSIGRRLILPLVERFRTTLPKARLAIVEGLSTHVTEWIATGRVDLGLVHNPEPNPAIEVTRLTDEPLGLVGPADESSAPLRWSELGAYPLILPERGHAMRRLLEAQAGFAGVRLKVVMEVSSIPSILDLVAAGYGHAVLTETALASWRRAGTFSLRRLVDPSVSSTLFMAVSAHKPITPLGRRAMALLQDLVKTEMD